MKVFVVIAFVLILGSLFSALLFMIKGGKDAKASKRMATALGFRVGFSVTLFLIIMLLYALGYIQPTGVPIR
jgi:hypothetical protein